MGSVSVVILNYNGVGFLKEFLPALITYNDGYDIVVADNASTDDSVAVLEDQFPNLELIKLEKNFGFAGGYNEALKKIDTEYYVLLNSDVEVTQGWLNPLVRFMEDDPKVAACQPKIKSYDKKGHFEYAGAAGGFLDINGFPFCRGRVFASVEEDKGQYDENMRVFWSSGACMLVRASVYHEMGGLDDQFFAHMEEIDLCWRMNSAGYQVYCLPETKVYHVGGGTLAVNSPRKVYLNFRNSLLMLYKNLDADDFNAKYRKRLFFDLLAIVNFIVTLQFHLVTTIFKAHKDFAKMKVRYDVKDRGDVVNLLTNEQLVMQNSVVWEYFLKGRRKFQNFLFK